MGQLLAFADTPLAAQGDALVARYVQHMPMYNMYRTESLNQQAAAIAEQLARTPEGRRAVTPFFILAFELKASDFPVDAETIFDRGYMEAPRSTRVLHTLAAHLARRGVKLDLLYCDNENDLGANSLGMDRIKAIYKREAALERMPPEARAFDPETVVPFSPEAHRWHVAFGRYINQIRIEGLRKAIFDSGLVAPWDDQTTIVNYYTLHTSFMVYDYNGWEVINNTLVDGRTSCPVAYPWAVGHRYRDRAHHPLWNSFIDCLNHARSAAAGSAILPVIREPLRPPGHDRRAVHPGARWIHEQMIGHLVRTGAERFMFFHPAAAEADDRALAEILERHDGATPKERQVLPEIPLDVDEVTTGDLTTRYAEFMEQGVDGLDYR